MEGEPATDGKQAVLTTMARAYTSSPRTRAFIWPSSSALMEASACCLLVGAVILGGHVGFNVVIAAIALWALIGPKQTVQSLTLTWLVVMLNPGLAEPPA